MEIAQVYVYIWLSFLQICILNAALFFEPVELMPMQFSSKSNDIIVREIQRKKLLERFENLP